ncbi:HD domain-containing protein [candidate division TA06 bacterium]|uniref:HD domain-containing protein n=2 Tax=candidate division TA06 bacterium TaxID=2250710 RepID=A0A523UNQ4_UNCT6|nr:MAG: HD domain-containing protein [candidate division TA06 bacterium]
MHMSFSLGLKLKLALLSLFLICATVGTYGSFDFKRERLALENQILAMGRAIASNLASNCSDALRSAPDDFSLVSLLKETASDKTIGYAQIVDETGRIVAHNDISMCGAEYVPSSRQLLNPIHNRIIDIYASRNGQLFYDFSAPVREATERQLSTVHVGIPVLVVDEFIKQGRNRLAVVALVLLGVGIAVSMIMAGIIMKPLEKLAKGAERIGNGDLAYRIEMSRRDEFGLLANSINSMASKLGELYLNTLQMLANALEAKDVYTRGHTERVTRLSVEIAKKMRLPKAEVETIRRAAMIHDIGKIGIRESILNKPGRLTVEEYNHIKSHVDWGAHILKPITSLTKVVSYLFHHHERFDGSGYPSGLSGIDIPLGARIIGVADSYDASTSERPYRVALSHDAAVRALINGSGTLYDPSVVNAFLEVIKFSPLSEIQDMPRDEQLPLTKH